MKRVKLTVAYDGTNYCGWQVQPKDIITIEGVLNKTLSDFLGENIEVIGASRTDSGVHALGNVAVFDTETKIPAEKISYALNSRLPKDIVIRNSCETNIDFHPRHCDCIKTYEYRIYNDEFANPLFSRYSYFVYRKLDIDAIRKAAEHIIGRHDFKSFCAAGSQVKDTTREIYSVEIIKENDNKLITIRVKGNGFLYNMVRIIAGTLIDVGTGLIKPDSLKYIIDSCDRTKAGRTAPANGLTLVEIKYL